MTDSTEREPGRIEVICGCMFSGKSDRLIERVQDARRDALRVAVFKHASDTRYDQTDIVTHDRQRLTARAVQRAEQLLEAGRDADVIAIDEAQFFDAALPEVCRDLARAGKRVVVAGLDRDSWGLSFGPMPEVIELADEVTRMTTACAVCGEPAGFTQRVTPVGESMIGGEHDYEPRCEKCFTPPPAALRR